jgi:alkanesulfonate monooxygenase SsuD/methylene tetrahydromethanopterin reductase-like flavin-dependent oxidoreductase (luciferase family)
MTTPFGPTPAEAIAQLQEMVDLGVNEFAVFFWDLRSAEIFVNEVVPAFR